MSNPECALCGCGYAFHRLSDGEYSRPRPCIGDEAGLPCPKNCQRFFPLKPDQPTDAERIDRMGENVDALLVVIAALLEENERLCREPGQSFRRIALETLEWWSDHRHVELKDLRIPERHFDTLSRLGYLGKDRAWIRDKDLHYSCFEPTDEEEPPA
jgi:hypothetical protein